MIRILYMLQAIGRTIAALFDPDHRSALSRVSELEQSNARLQAHLKQAEDEAKVLKVQIDASVMSAHEWKTRFNLSEARRKAESDLSQLFNSAFAKPFSAPKKKPQGVSIQDIELVEKMIRLCHPDRHSGANDPIANDVTKKLLEMRKELKQEPVAAAPKAKTARKKKG